MARVGGNRGAHLRANALVGAQQRQVPVGRAAGDDLDQAGVVEVAEALNDVSVQRVEVLQRGLKEAPPEARGLGQVVVAGLDEVGLVLARGDDLARDVLGKLGDEERMGELLQQDRREIEVEVGRDPIPFQIAQHPQQRQIGLGGGLVQPLHAMRPGAVVHHIGQMRMEGDGEKACRSFRCLRHEGLQESASGPRGYAVRCRCGGMGCSRPRQASVGARGPTSLP